MSGSAFWRAEARFDWERYVEDAGGVRAVHSRAGEYLLTCPDCLKKKLAINVIERAWRCFTCSDGGRDAASLVAKIEQRMFHEAMDRVLSGDQLAVGRIDQVESRLGARRERRRVEIPGAMAYPDGFVSLAGHPSCLSSDQLELRAKAVGYYQFREIDDYVAHEMRLGYCTKGRYRNRLIFPVFDSGQRLVFYQGRAMWPEAASTRKYIKTLSPKLEEGYAGASDVLLNLQYLLDRGMPERVLVVEGPIDTAHAFPDAVCSFGKQLSARQMQLLVRAGVKKIDLGFDPEEMRHTEKQAALLSDLFEIRVVRWPAGKDPGVLTKPQIEYHRSLARIWGDGGRLAELNHALR